MKRSTAAVRASTGLAAVGLAAAALGGEPPQPASTEQIFTEGMRAIERVAYREAVDQLELLSDRGFQHPDASFDRAVAYVGRSRASSAEPGDLGQAAAALAETLLLRPGDEEAERALERIREEIAHRRAREGASPVIARPSLGRAVVEIWSEDGWSLGAALGSLLVTAGLALRLWTRAPPPRLAGAIALGVGAVLLAGSSTLAYAARALRTDSAPAVVVAPEARLLDERGAPAPSTPATQKDSNAIPEGASVAVLERRGQLTRIEWGTARATSGWVAATDLRLLARP